VYAGIDPLSGRRHYLTEVVPPGPKATTEAEKVRTRFLAEVASTAPSREPSHIADILVRVGRYDRPPGF
jgi:integrase